ncbi:hypothetical protein DLJ61_14615 [Gordonia terrae]|uniref:Uncharacterized protein n=1 Tax=Gordonia terrae TaxID=2055 RepID=A0AAD0KA76_9ACTN|nr:hypothetical protein BCM27_14485 [Gordonia terrae]AWO84570.1 hypothetical protein DLJ61_14615 [Gordonia terrae]VTQ90210.1 Uncharacterised protein [Clostridioides difficile]
MTVVTMGVRVARVSWIIGSGNDTRAARPIARSPNSESFRGELAMTILSVAVGTVPVRRPCAL